MYPFQNKILSTLLGAILLGTSNWVWAEEPDSLSGVIPQACQEVRATYKADRREIHQSCLEERDARTHAQQYCSENRLWNPYCHTPCDQTPPTTGGPKDTAGHQAHADLCLAKQALEDCRAQKAVDLKEYQLVVNEICCPFWPCRVVSCPSIVGEWIINFDWHCDGSSGTAPITFNADGTASFSGNWSQNRCDMQILFPNGTTYTGNVNTDGTHLSGTMAMGGGGSTGCWTADRVNSGAGVPTANNEESLDIAGNSQ
jgi:hypothetical protein